MTPDFSPLINDLTLSYRWRATPGKAAGLVILMHGIGSNEDSLLGLGNFLPDDYAVALVRSPLVMGQGAYSAFAVNFTANGPQIDAVAAESSRQKLTRFLPELQARYGIPAERTIVAGFSQGGIMSASLALTAPAHVRGFAILSGRILPEIEPLIAPVPELQHLAALVVHGDADDRLPPFWADHSEALLKGRGVSLRSQRYPMGHEIRREVAADFAHWVQEVLLR